VGVQNRELRHGRHRTDLAAGPRLDASTPISTLAPTPTVTPRPSRQAAVRTTPRSTVCPDRCTPAPITTSSPKSSRQWSVTSRLLIQTRRPRRAPFSFMYQVQTGVVRRKVPANTRTRWIEIE
jgi:hypothetical protein